jgi:hypothetical protein
MKRKKTILGGSSYSNLKKNITPEQLAGIGAVCLAWNDVEDYVEMILADSLGLNFSVINRINGVGTIVEILREHIARLVNQYGTHLDAGRAVRFMEDLGTEIETSVKAAFDAVMKYKIRRDRVVHARIRSRGTSFGLVPRRKEIVEVSLSAEDLDTFFDHLVSLRIELDATRELVFHSRELSPLFTQMLRLGPDLQQREQSVRGAIELVHLRRDHRLSLPQLPEFPT